MSTGHGPQPSGGASKLNHRVALTVDLEDWHDGLQLRAVQPRVEQHTDWLLERFDAYGVKATFFTLGSVAERHPELVKKIAKEGHEIGFHGAEHRFLKDVGPQQFGRQLRRWRPTLQDLVGQPIDGFRAPYFSLNRDTRWAFDELIDAGFSYDASVYPGLNDRYGWRGAPRTPVRVGASQLVEFPVPLLPALGMAYSGGAYLRLLPKRLVQLAMWLHLRTGMPGMIYAHPFEAASWLRWRTAASLRANATRHLFRGRFRGCLEQLLAQWSTSMGTMGAVIDKLEQITQWWPEGADESTRSTALGSI